MKILLDTHVLLWVVLDSPRLSKTARRRLADAEEVHVSSVSLWEIEVKVAIGKLPVDQERLDAEIERSGFLPLPVTHAHARALRDLPLHHSDPFDRLLVAQAMSEPLHFLTHDAVLQAYSPFIVVV